MLGLNFFNMLMCLVLFYTTILWTHCEATTAIMKENVYNSRLFLCSYNACVRQYDGYCYIQYQACADQENSFSLDVRGNGAYLNDDFCNMDYISIPGKHFCKCFFKWANSRHFFIYFCLIKQTLQFLQ